VLQLIHGPGTDSEVELTVVWRGESSVPADLQLDIRGPYSQLGRTLTARFPLSAAGQGRWRTRIIDPLYWTPDQPAQYRLAVTTSEPEIPAQIVFGLRRLEAAKNSLWLDRRRWVFRAAWGGAMPTADLQAFHATPLGLLVDSTGPNAAGMAGASIFSAASEQGVPLMVRLSCSDWRHELSRIVVFPACLLLALPAETDTNRAELTELAPNVLKVAEFVEGGAPQVPDWCHAMLAPAAPQLLQSLRAASGNRPLMAWKRSAPLASAAEARRAAELLQQQLAPEFDLSGYVVS
jgi:hypothetical protein